MLIQGLQKLTLLDYPEHIACALFSYGCNLRCPFCHNAGLVVRKAENLINTDDITAFLNKRRGILDGICLTGGEPLAQSDVIEFLRYLRSFGYKIKLDTNGFYTEKLKTAVDEGLLDYIAMDIKSSAGNYSDAVGVKDIDITPLYESIEIIKNSGIDYEFRTTAVKGLHSLADFKDIAKWLQGSKRYYIQQFADSGDLITENYSAFSEDEIQAFLSVVKEKIPNAQIRGI